MSYQPHPLRVQLSRKKGWRKPEGAIVVARPRKWGNPYKAGEIDEATGRTLDRATAVRLFRNFVMQTAWPELRASIVEELRGKQLCCWCPLDQPCHADVLAEIANA